MKAFLTVAALAIAAFPALAAQPYAGQQGRSIKALSASDVQGHLDGKGLGYAKAAELNHYPGPLHLRELTEQIALTPEQMTAIQSIEADMKAQAKALGAQVIAEERALDTLFATATATAAAVEASTVKIGQLKGRLRAAHLNAHVAVRPLLSRHQITLYDQLRGYGGGKMDHGSHHH